MSSLAIIGFVLMVSGFSIWMIAGFRYEPYIQRYLEKFGVAPSAFFSEFRDYVNAKKIAKKWGHRPEFIRGYEKLGVFALALFVFGLLLLLSVEFLGLGDSID